MQKVRLNATDLEVSRLCLGTVNFGLALQQPEVNRHLDAFVDLGGNFLDTAHVYSDWVPGERNRCEKAIGRWVKDGNREKVIIATKGGHFDFAAPAVSRVTPEELRRDLRESLQCLNTDYVDIFMLHRDNEAMPVATIMDCLADFVREGKARYLACSNWTAERTRQANEYAKAKGLPAFVVNEVMWSMAKINPDGIPSDYVTMDDGMMALGRETGLNFMAYSALAHGYLTKRCAGREIDRGLARTYDNPHNDELVRRLSALPTAEDVTRENLRYFLHQGVTAIPLVTCNTLEQMKNCVSAFE